MCPHCATMNPSTAINCRSCGSALQPAHPNALPHGYLLHGGMFELDHILGMGGFGITYLATFAHTGDRVAIKEFFPYGSHRRDDEVVPMHDDAVTHKEQRMRFQKEAVLLTRLKHPNIVPVYTCFEENNTAYMVMGYVEGQPVQTMLTDRGSLPEGEALSIINACSQALGVVHSAGLLHRDIKPGNILVTGTGRVILIDFGNARAFASVGPSRMTAIVTPGYAPLEQYLSHKDAHFGPYTDTYALGATLYHMLTGQMPVPSIDRVQGVELPDPRALNAIISPRVSTAILRSLNMKAPERHQSVREFIDDVSGSSPSVSPALEPELLGWVARLQHLRHALAHGDDERVLRLLGDEPTLERLLFDTQRSDLAAVRQRQMRLASLRAFLHSGDDAGIAREVTSGDAPLQFLLPAEKTSVSRAMARVHAMETLIEAVQRGDPQTIVAAWQTAIRSSCRIPQSMADRVRASRLATMPDLTSPGPPPPDPPARTPVPLAPLGPVPK